MSYGYDVRIVDLELQDHLDRCNQKGMKNGKC